MQDFIKGFFILEYVSPTTEFDVETTPREFEGI